MLLSIIFYFLPILLSQQVIVGSCDKINLQKEKTLDEKACKMMH